MNKKNATSIIIIAIAIVAFVFYRQISTYYKEDSHHRDNHMEEMAHLRELKGSNEYEIPGGTHTVAFTFYIDNHGVIQNLYSEDLLDPDHQVRMEEFNMMVLPTIKGKKLSELESIDKVGTSSLTTEAFNTVLADIKAQL